MAPERFTRLVGGLALVGQMATSLWAQAPAEHQNPSYSTDLILQQASGQALQEDQATGSGSSELVNISSGCCHQSLTGCDLCEPPRLLMEHLLSGPWGGTLERYGIRLGGWLEQGVTWNPDSPDDRSNFPVTFNDRSNEYQLNQVYLFIERPVDPCSSCWDIGGRIDLLVGTDYYFTEALGLELEQSGSEKWNSRDGPRASRDILDPPGSGAALYGLALPQLYAELFAPIAGGITLKAGHFYKILGYEQVPAVNNFFYSHGYTFQYGEPFTHTGLLASYNVHDNLVIQAGMTLGSESFSNPNDNLGLLSGIRWTSQDCNTTVAWAMHVSDEDPALRPLDSDGFNRDDSRYVQSIVFTRKLWENLTYVFQTDFGVEDDASFDNQFNDDDAEWYSTVSYLFYEITECLSVGARYEWFRDDDHARILQVGALADGGEYREFTLGINWKPHANVLLRPEARWDWSDTDLRSSFPGLVGAFDDRSDKNQFTVGIDVIVRY